MDPGRLPIAGVLEELTSALREHGSVVAQAPPGSGKTTRIPPHMFDAGLAGGRDIVVIEPRRLAARLSAIHVASQLGTEMGALVGYQVRFENRTSAATRIRYVTDGVMARRMVSHPSMDDVGVLILDEFHERRIHGDILLGMARLLQTTTRPDLRIIVMSATLDTQPVSCFLGSCPVVRAEGTLFPVAIEYADRSTEQPLAQRVSYTLTRLIDEGLDGDVLVFLPGAAEIRACMKSCGPIASQKNLTLAMLHGDLAPAQQDLALAHGDRRKVILSTNVAESSLTIDGISVVIDSGLARQITYAAWSGVPRTTVDKISRASAAQRAGRAGRTRPGRCIRLYSEHDHDTRRSHDQAEVHRNELSEALLYLAGLGTSAESFPWLERPADAAVQAATEMLRDLQLIDDRGNILPNGRRALCFPVHPRTARVMVESERLGAVQEGCLAAALLEEREIVAHRRTHFGTSRGASSQDLTHWDSDLERRMDLFRRAQELGFTKEALEALGVDRNSALAVERIRRQLLRLVRAPNSCAEDESALRRCLLAGFPDRVGRRQRDRSVAMAAGGQAQLAPDSVVDHGEFLVAVDAEERQDAGGRRVVIRQAAVIDVDWLLDLGSEHIHESVEVQWNEKKEQVEARLRILYRGLCIDESRDSRDGPEVSRALAQAAVARGAEAFAPPGALRNWLGRLAFVEKHAPESGIRALDEPAINDRLTKLCEGMNGFRQLREAGFLDLLRAELSPSQRAALDRLAPDQIGRGESSDGGPWIRIGAHSRGHRTHGRILQVHYEGPGPPWVESRLQDFFGVAQSPTIADGKVALTLRLLGPNRRPVQVTNDLASFWRSTYPELRPALSRRYPKHHWPVDGSQASPPPAGRLRPG